MSSDFIHVVEVSPRDGLQNIAKTVPTALKKQLIENLQASGLRQIEVTSFVSPKKIPQMSDHVELFASLDKALRKNYIVLIPNQVGMERALGCGVESIAVFAAASQKFSLQNLGCTIEQSLQNYQDVIQLAQHHQISVRGYVSCVLGCPYEGKVSVKKVVEVAKKLFYAGCSQISLGDTIGVGTPTQAREMILAVAEEVPVQNLALHFHDTYGQALANIVAGLECGVTTVDSSVAGLGGCPYAPGASGNVATEEVIYLLHGMGYQTGVNLDKLIKAGQTICQALQIENRSKVARARQK